MRLRRGLTAVAVLVGGLLAGALPAVAAVPAAATAPYCGITWGSGPRSGSVAGPSGAARQHVPLVGVRTGQHACFDRVVFDVYTGVGYRVSYGEAYTQGRGQALSPYTAGGALLNVVLTAPVYRVVGAYPADVAGDHLARVVGYRTLRDAVYGDSFEGYTTIAVGVRARLPYRVFTLPGTDSSSRIVIDVAHRRTA